MSSMSHVLNVLSQLNMSAKDPDFFVYFHFPYELEQNQSISLTNSADVGSPRRIIQIWKISLYATTPELIFTLSRKNRHLYIHFIN